MRMSRCLTAGVLFVGVVALAWAQQPGFQGFGFGSGATSLVTNKAVVEELKLSEEQAAKLKEWAKTESEKIQAMRKEKLADIDFKSDEGRAKFAAFNAESGKMAYADLEKSGLLTADQVKRVRQIDRQNQGMRAFTNAEVAETLKLTEEQKAKIKGISDEFNKDSQAIRQEMGIGGGFGKDKQGGGKFDPTKFAEANKKIDKLQASAMEKITDTLTADQKAQWKEMVGAPFDTSRLRQRFGPPTKKDEE